VLRRGFKVFHGHLVFIVAGLLLVGASLRALGMPTQRLRVQAMAYDQGPLHK